MFYRVHAELPHVPMDELLGNPHVTLVTPVTYIVKEIQGIEKSARHSPALSEGGQGPGPLA